MPKLNRTVTKVRAQRSTRAKPGTKPASPIASTLLTKPGKMPGYAFGLPAGISCPFSKVSIKLYGDRSTCHWCYAMAGRYIHDNVALAMKRRWEWVRASLAEDHGEVFVAVMVKHIRYQMDRRPANDRVFRIHDSGDFFSVEYVRAWQRVVRHLPDVRFWAPTREHNRPVMLAALTELAAMPNVIVRPSAVQVNAEPPRVEGFGAGTSVYDREQLPNIPKGVKVCPSSLSTDPEKKTCDSHGCRACWFATDTPVAYLYHGSATEMQRRGAAIRRGRNLPIMET